MQYLDLHFLVLLLFFSIYSQCICLNFSKINGEFEDRKFYLLQKIENQNVIVWVYAHFVCIITFLL